MTELQQIELFNAPDPSLALVENKHTAKHRAEAEGRGIQLLSKSERGCDYRRYLLACGCEAEIQIVNVREGRFKCNECHAQRWIAEAADQGLTLMGKSAKGKDYRRYEFNACGHVDDIPPSLVRKGQFKCNECHAQRWIAEAADQGLTLMGKSAKGSDYRLYRCSACEHEADIKVSDVRRGSFRCSRCLHLKISEEALYNGLCMLGKSARGAAYRSYRLPCGHELSIRPEDVRIRNFRCRVCNDNPWELPSQAYLLKINPPGANMSFLKLGFSRNIQKRFSDYGLPNGSAYEILKTVSFKTGKEACEFEQTAHHVWKDKKIEPTCSMKNGFTECYPMDWCQTIMQAMEAATQP